MNILAEGHIQCHTWLAHDTNTGVDKENHCPIPDRYTLIYCTRKAIKLVNVKCINLVKYGMLKSQKIKWA